MSSVQNHLEYFDGKTDQTIREKRFLQVDGEFHNQIQRNPASRGYEPSPKWILFEMCGYYCKIFRRPPNLHRAAALYYGLDFASF
jgi:hypothetical protein